MSRQGQVRLFAGAVLLLVFSTGAFVGAAALDDDGATGQVGSVRVNVDSHLGEIDLTAGQRTALDSLLEARQPQIDSIIRAAIDELHEVLDSVDVEVRAVLLPGQLEAYDALRAGRDGVRAVRRTQSPDGTFQVDTIR